ncbi:hypothetical protein B5M09_001061 [Aphanomyces astaci]|uniref:Jacalin-type lectin domain-containing protein n=1 Tax=Aphanomyces astaci TaxID=112090 RepID=A0A3R7WZ71_APHAT|nr:hypothetical protein B5M09_001061 [Aphanomyces astaci]
MLNMEQQRREKRQETAEKLAAEFPIPKWFDLSLPALQAGDATASAVESSTKSPMKPRVSLMNSAVQLDILRQQIQTAGPTSSVDKLQRRSTMTALHPKRSMPPPTLPRLPNGADQYGLWQIHTSPSKHAPLQKSMTSTDMLRVMQAQQQNISLKKIVDPWATVDPVTAPRSLKSHASGGSLRHLSSVYSMSRGDDSNNSLHVERVLHTNGMSATAMDMERIRTEIHQYMASHWMPPADDDDDQGVEDVTTINTDTVHVHVARKDAVAAHFGPRLISYDMMRDIFYPKDPSAIATWTAELDAEKKAAAADQAERDRQLERLEQKSTICNTVVGVGVLVTTTFWLVKQRLQTTAQGMLRVLDRFDFMHTTWANATVQAATTTQLFKLIFRQRNQKLLVHDDTADDHRSVPAVLHALLQTYSRNRGLDDMDLEDAAHVFHDVAATAIQNGARRYFDRKATFWFPERQQFFAFQLKKRVFRAWRGRAQQLHHQRMLVYRKFVAWRHHVVLAARYREMYRICFWPLYVWKRYVQFVLLSRSKSMFLRLVFHTYVQLRILRGWRRYGVDAVDLAVMLETLALERLDSSRRFADREATLVGVKNAELRLQQDEESKSNGMRSQLHHCASQMLVSKFEAYLVEQEFMLIPTVLGKKLVYNAFKAVFVRWVEWTQLTFATNAITRQFRTRSAIRRLGQVFVAWKVQLKAKYIVLPSFSAEKRPTADMERVRSSLWSLRKHLVSKRIRKVLGACDRKLKLSVCSNPTLKHLFAMHSKDIMKRLNLENRLMFVAYNERQLNVICGKSVDGIAVLVKSYNHTVEGKIHGNPFGNSSVFPLGPGEFIDVYDSRLVAIEGYATQSTILGLRFGTSQGRWSKWYGRADAGLPFLLQGGDHEEIVGLHGYAAKDSVHGLGVCFRRTTEHNVFEGLWIDHITHKFDSTHTPDDAASAPPPAATEDRINFSYFLQMRSCDVYAAMDRSHKLALRMWRSESIPDEVKRLRIVMAVCRWFFNAQVHGLVALTDKENEGRRILQDGINIRASGEKLLAEGDAVMALVDKYREGRKQQLNLTLLGFKKIQELRHNMEVGDDKIKRGKQLIADGNTEILRGKQLLPKIPLTERMLHNIRGLYRVVQTKDSMDAMSDGIKKLLLNGQPIATDTTLVDLKEVAEANDNAAFDMGQARAEVVSSKLRETLTRVAQ